MKQVALVFKRRIADGRIDNHAADMIANHRFGCDFVSVTMTSVSVVIFGMLSPDKIPNT